MSEADTSDETTEASSIRVRPIVGVLVAAVVGLTTFGITAAVRGGDGDASPTPPPTSDIAETATDAAGESTSPAPSSTPPDEGSAGEDEEQENQEDAALPTIIEVEATVLAPIETDETGVPLPPPDVYEGTAASSAVVSPIVGTATTDVVMTADGRAITAPAVFADVFGPSAAGIDELLAVEPSSLDLDALGPIEPVDVAAEIDVEDLLDEIKSLTDPVVGERPGVDSEGEVIESDGVGIAPDDRAPIADPCADDPDPGRCPDPGEPGTVVATFALTVPPPLSVNITIPAAGECGGETSINEQRIAVRSSAPLDSFEMTYWRSGWPSDNIGFSIATPDDEATAWVDAFIASTADPPPPIVHCATLGGLTPGWNYQFHATAADVFDQTWTTYGRTPPYFDGPDEVIPPTYLLNLSDNELLVSTPHRDDQRAAILAYRRNGEPLDAPVDPCGGTDRVLPGFELPWSPIELDRVTTTPAALRANGFDPDYIHRTMGTLRLAEGSSYRLCIHTSTLRPSFSAGVERTEAYDIFTPDALELTFTVLRVDTIDDAELPTGALDVDIAPTGRGIMVGFPFCGSWRNSSAISGNTAIGSTICTSDPRSSALYDRSARVTMTATDLDGERHQTTSLLPIQSCRMPCAIPETEVYRLDLPTGRPQQDFWCGLFGDGCDRPSGDSFGTITIAVGYGNPGGNIRSEWSISDSSELGDSRPPEPETPRLDTQQILRVSGSGSAPSVTVPVRADRRVSVDVELRASDGSPACTLDGGPTSSSSASFQDSHNVTFDNLCPRQYVVPIVELTDEDGFTSRWHGMTGEPAFGPAEWWGRGFLFLEPITLEASASIEITVPSPAVRFHEVSLDLAGRSMVWNRYISSGGPGCQVPRGAPLTAVARAAVGDPGGLFRVSTDRDVEIELVVEAELLVEGCGQAVDEQPPPFAVSTVIPFDDIVFGEPIELTGTQAVPALGDDATIDATATITFVREV